MNNRRDEQYGRQQFGRHNEEWDDERYRDRDGGERERLMSGPTREGYGGEWRTEGLGGYGEGLRGGYSYVEQGLRGESMRGGPMMGQRRWVNEGLSNDFSIEGTRNFSRDERRGARVSQRGKGPKGFTRSDDRIREDVCQILTDHQDIDASDIEVEVKGGEVTLTGTVIDRWTKRLAEAVVENVSGIVDVHNRVRVAPRDVKSNQPSAPVSQGRSGSNGERTTTSRSH